MNFLQMLGFIPKPEVPEPVVLKIPAADVQRILKLRDDYDRLPRGQDAEAHYLLWNAIAEIYPCVRTGRWRIETSGALNVTIVELPDE